MDRRSAFIAVRENSQMSEEGSEYECEISYPPPPHQPHPLQQFRSHPQTPQSQHHQSLSHHHHLIHPAYWYWHNAYSQLLEQQAEADL